MRTHLKHKRITAIVICALFISVLVISIAFLSVEANHECIGRNCPICAQMQLVHKTIDQLGSALSLVLYSGFTLVAPFLCVFRLFSFIAINTPVTQNVRMNN